MCTRNGPTRCSPFVNSVVSHNGPVGLGGGGSRGGFGEPPPPLVLNHSKDALTGPGRKHPGPAAVFGPHSVPLWRDGAVAQSAPCPRGKPSKVAWGCPNLRPCVAFVLPCHALCGPGFVYKRGEGLLALRLTRPKKILTPSLAEGKSSLNKLPFVGPSLFCCHGHFAAPIRPRRNCCRL